MNFKEKFKPQTTQNAKTVPFIRHVCLAKISQLQGMCKILCMLKIPLNYGFVNRDICIQLFIDIKLILSEIYKHHYNHQLPSSFGFQLFVKVFIRSMLWNVTNHAVNWKSSQYVCGINTLWANNGFLALIKMIIWWGGWYSLKIHDLSSLWFGKLPVF